jgi:hypothetical protein
VSIVILNARAIEYRGRGDRRQGRRVRAHLDRQGDHAGVDTRCDQADRRTLYPIHRCGGQRHKTRLVAVRFDNVIGTAGSVVPRFRAQIEGGGPVTVTSPDMVRYFMTKRDATDLLWTPARITASQVSGTQSAILVLNMGQPVRIDDLARRMIRLAGFEPDREMAVVYTGQRPGSACPKSYSRITSRSSTSASEESSPPSRCPASAPTRQNWLN